jgi:hypothetical protein
MRLAVPDAVAATIQLSVPPTRRDRTPIKLAFGVQLLQASSRLT